MATKKDDTKDKQGIIPAPGGGVSLSKTSDAATGSALQTIDAETQALFTADSATMAPKFTAEDLAIPFLRILQGLSPEVTRGNEKYLPDARPSMFIETVTREVFDGEAGVVVVPVHFTQSYTEWVPRAKGGGFVKDWKQDGSNLTRCHKDETTGRDVTPEGTEMVRAGLYYILLVNPATGVSRPAVLSLSGTQLKKARRWNSIIMQIVATNADGTPFTPAMFYMSYLVTSVPEKNDKGSWFGFNINAGVRTVDIPNGVAVYKKAREFAGQAIQGTVKTQPIQDAVVEAIVDEAPPADQQGGAPGDAF